MSTVFIITLTTLFLLLYLFMGVLVDRLINKYQLKIEDDISYAIILFWIPILILYIMYLISIIISKPIEIICNYFNKIIKKII